MVEELAADASAPHLDVEEVSILDDAALHERFVEEIPVVLINDRVHNYWRIDPARLRSALLALPASRG